MKPLYDLKHLYDFDYFHLEGSLKIDYMHFYYDLSKNTELYHKIKNTSFQDFLDKLKQDKFLVLGYDRENKESTEMNEKTKELESVPYICFKMLMITLKQEGVYKLEYIIAPEDYKEKGREIKILNEYEIDELINIVKQNGFNSKQSFKLLTDFALKQEEWLT